MPPPVPQSTWTLLALGGERVMVKFRFWVPELPSVMWLSFTYRVEAPTAVTQAENSDVFPATSLAVAVTICPPRTETGTSTVKLPLPELLVVTVPAPR